jgi:hypothetical protein
MVQNILKLKDLVRHNLIFLIVLEIAIGLIAITLPLKYGLILLLGLPVVVILLLRPFYTYLLGIFLLPFWAITFTGAQQVSGEVDFRFADIAFILAAIGLMIKMSTEKDFDIRKSPLDLPMILLFAWMALSFVWGTSFLASLIDLFKKIYGLAIFYLTLNIVRQRKDLNTVLIVWVITGLSMGVIGLYELMTTGLQFAEPLAETTIAHWGEPVRTSAYAENPNKLAFDLGICIYLTLAFYSINKKLLVKVFAFFTLILMLIVFASTLSRIGLIAFSLSLFFFLVVAPKIRKPVTVVVLVGFFAFLLISTTAYREVLYQRLLGIIEPSTTEDLPGRLNIWMVGLKMFIKQPVFGVGVGSFHQLASTFGAINLDSPHNIFIYILSEFGLVGISLFAFLIAKFIAEVRQGFRKISDASDKLILYGLITAIVSYPLQGMISSFRLRENNMWAILGLIFASIRIFTSQTQHVSVKELRKESAERWVISADKV